MATLLKLVPLTLLGGMILGGCVTQPAYDDLADTAMTIEDRNQALLQDNQELQRQLDSKSNRIAQIERENDGLRSEIGKLGTAQSSLRANLQQYDERLATMSTQGGVDAQTDYELRILAQQHSQLVTYDEQRGMLRFNSDFTFAPGSDTVKSSAAGGIKELAKVLTGDAASRYIIRVDGHTDNQRISNPTTRKRFRNNRILSIYRANAVSESLQKFGVPSQRILVAGWGANQPTVANNAKGGTAANRRVEIFLVPASDAGAVVGVPVSADSPEMDRAPRSQPASKPRTYPMK